MRDARSQDPAATAAPGIGGDRDADARMDPLAAIADAEARGIRFVQLQFTDILGIVKAVTIPIHQLAGSVTHGTWFDGSSIEGFTRIAESDQYLMPDMRTFAEIPWQKGSGPRGTARVICDVFTPRGEPFVGDPRYILRRQVDRARKLGFIVNMGPELEFFLFRRDESGKVAPLPHDLAVGATPEQEELELRAHVHEVAELPCPLDLAAQDVSGIAGKGLATRGVDVADDACRATRAGALEPRDLREGPHVRHEVLVALGDPGKALDRRAVEPRAVADRALELVDRDGHRLDGAHDVGELELDEADALGLGALDELDP